MDSSNKGSSTRPRRPRSVPPGNESAGSLLPVLKLQVEVPRFLDAQAPLAVLAAQIRNARDPAEKASSAGRLARILVKRGIEMREAISLAENSLALRTDTDLALALADWWVEAGDSIRGAALLQSTAEDLQGRAKSDALLRAARLYARSGQVHQAVQALRNSMEISPHDPRAFETHGSFGFWAEIPSADSARSYLRAAELRTERGEKGIAFENLLRAFEVAPTEEDAAVALSDALGQRGRPGAADEIFREHLRRGSAAKRAAHHERAFYAALSDSDPVESIESALEAELDLQLDPERVAAELRQPSVEPEDFEGFLFDRARNGNEIERGAFVEWILTLIDAHVFDWDADRVSELRAETLREFRAQTAPAIEDSTSDQTLRALRKELGFTSDTERLVALRQEIALRECARGAWGDAFEVFEPLLEEPAPPLRVAALGAIIAGRCRRPLSRARALTRLGGAISGPLGAMAHAVAAEMLMAHGQANEAWEAANLAVEADPKSERAVASQALVALSAPEHASAGLLERSLSVLVARADACALLCRSANERGSERLGLTWAARALALRPGDERVTRAFLNQATSTKDPEKIMDALATVLDLDAPLAPQAWAIGQAVRALTGLTPEKAEEVGAQVLAAVGVRATETSDALMDLARTSGSPGLLSATTERQLVFAPIQQRAGLSLTLCRQRLRAGQGSVAARALRRALGQGAERALVSEMLQDFEPDMDADGKIALMEIKAELLSEEEVPEGQDAVWDRKRADALRVLGAARWDMAQDNKGAIFLWLRAADLDPERGLEYLAHYLHQIAGPEAAAKHLQIAARQTEDPRRSARLLGLAAHELFELKRTDEAFDVAKTALERAPLMTELLGIAEACAPADRLDDLIHLYDLLADASLGRYGERAVHYRAARQLEKRGLPEKALSHACSAFEAVPAEGVAFVLMARLADSTAGHAALVASLEKAADQAPSDAERARWLAKAGALADTETVGRRQRVDILLRAAQMLPEQATIIALLDSLAHFLADEPTALDELWEKFEHVAENSLRHASGAHGAQMAIVFGSAGVTHFDKPDFTLKCLRQAIELDREIPDYDKLTPLATQLAGLPEQASAFVEEVRKLVERDTMLLGRGLAALAGRIAELLGEPEVQTELLVRAATDFPEDAELVSRARALAKRSGNEELVQQIESLLPITDRANSILRRLSDLTDSEGLDQLLGLDLDAAPSDLRVRLLEALGTRQEAMGRHLDAAISFRELYEIDPKNDLALRGIERDADQKGDYEELARVLHLRTTSAKDAGEARRLRLRRVAVLETKLGRGNEARELLAQMVEETQDLAALRMLADSWQRAGDPAEAAELWLRVQAVTQDVEEADDAAYRAAVCYSDSGVPRRAAESLALIHRPNVAHRKLGLELAREINDPKAIREQLVGLARVTVGDKKQVEALYLEAARLAIEARDFEKAESAAKGARLAHPQSSQARLVLARLRMRSGPLTDKDEATQMLAELDEAEDLTSATDLEIREYCRAQAARISESDDIARAILEQAIEDQGNRGLLSLGLAELLSDEAEHALMLYEDAVGAELHGLRGEGEVLFAAGVLARKQGLLERARAFMSAIADEDPMRVKAAKELEEIALLLTRAEREKREKRQAEEAERELLEADRRAREDQERMAAEARARAEQEQAQEQERNAALSRQVEEARLMELRAEVARKTQEEAELKRAQEEQKRESLRAEQQRQRAEWDAIREAARAEHRKETAAAANLEEEIVPSNSQRPSSPASKRSSPPTARRIPTRPSSIPPFTTAIVGEKVPHPRVPDLGEEIEMEEGRKPLPPSARPAGRSRRTSPISSPPPPSSHGGVHHPPPPLPASQRGAHHVPPPPSSHGGVHHAPPPPSSRGGADLASSGGVPDSTGLVSFPPVSEGPASIQSRTEDKLVEAFEAGHIGSGRELLRRLERDRARSRDAVVVAQHLVALSPGDERTLGLLVRAATRDGNDALAKAVRHVIGAYGQGDAIAPPDPQRLEEHGDAAISLINQGATTEISEAFGIVWEHCQGLYKKELSAYGISGVERVPLSSPTDLGALYRDAAKILGIAKTAVFRMPGQTDIAIQLGLLAPPAVIVSGEIDGRSSELAFHFGAMLAGAAPEHALVFGLPHQDVQNLLDALAVSFGSGRAVDGARPDPEVTRIAAFLWETIPSRAQRRLSRLCRNAANLDYHAITASSRRVLRRAGLLVCGDLATAVSDACLEAGLAPPTSLSELATCAAQSGAVADLFGLALSPEYAELRYRVAGAS